MAEIDSLNIKISAEASKADKAIDRLIGKLGKLSSALDFDTDITGISKQKQAFDSFGDTIKGISGTMDSLKKSMSGISDAVAPQTQKLANTIARIATAGDKSEQAAKSLSKIGDALSKVTTDMAGAKNIDSGINRFTSSIARLASAGDKSAVVAKELPKVGNALKETADKMAKVEQISDSTNSFTQAIAQLASAGDKAEKTASGLDQLADGTLRFFNAMKGAPQISENTIRMTQAMARLSSTGGRVSASMKPTNTAFQTVSKSLNSLSNVAKKASGTIKKAMSGIAKVVNGAFSKIGQIGIKASNAMKRVAGDMAAAFARITHSSRGLNTASSNLKNLLKTILGFKGLQALGRFGKNALELGSDITEVENVVDTAFGSMAGHAYAFASTAKEQFGLSELAAKQYSGTMMAMLKSSGVAQKQAAIMSTTLAGLAGDIASFYNIETDEAFYKLRSAISGETEPMKQLGVNMNIVNLEAFAMSKGITKAYKDMTLAEQATLRYEYILAKTTDAQGDFAKTAGTYANQLRLLKLNIQSISAVIGQGLIAAILPAIKWLNALMSKLMDVAKAFRNFMYTITGFQPDKSGGGIVDDMAGIGDAADDLGDLGDAAEDAGKKIKKNLLLLPFDELNVLSEASSDIADDLEDIGDIDTGLGDIGDLDKFDDSAVNEWAKKLRDAFLNQDWEGLGRIIAELINKGLEWLYKKIKQITPKVEQALKNLAKVINSFIKNLDWDLLGRTIGAGISLLTKAFNALFGDEGINLELLGEKLSTGLRGMIDEVDWWELGNAIGNYLMIAWRIAYGFIEDMWRIDPNTLLTGWAEAGNAIGDTLVGIFERIDFEKISAVLTEGFKGALETITYALNRFSENLDWIVGKVNLGLDRLYAGLKWDSTDGQDMGQKITALTDAISTAFNKLLDLDFGKVGQIIGAGITDIVRAFNQLTDIDTGGMDFEKLGAKLSNGLRKLVTEIPWEEFGNALGNGFMLPWRILDGFLNDMAKKSGAGLTGWQELGNGIADAINGLFDKFDLAKTASTISRLVNGIFETLRQAVENIRWDDIADNLADGLNGLIDGIEWEENGKALNGLIENLLGMLLRAAEKVKWEELGRQIGVFLSQIDWGKHLATVAKIIMEVLGGLLEGLGETPAGKLVAGFIKALLAIKISVPILKFVNKICEALSGKGALGLIGKAIGKIASLFGKIPKAAAPAVASTGSILSKIGTVIFSPKGLMIAGIVAGVALIIANWDTIVEAAHKLFEGLGNFFETMWEGINKATETIWNGITIFLQATFETISDAVVTIWGGIKEFFGTVWDGIKTATETVWNGLTTFLSDVWNGISAVAQDVWNGLSAYLSDTWNAIKIVADDVWGGIKELFGTLWEGIQEAAEEVWGALTTFLTDTWNAIKVVAEEVWGGIKEFFSTVWDGIQIATETVWNAITIFVTDVWNGIKTVAEEVWGGIKTFLTDTWNAIKKVAEDVWSGIKKAVIDVWDGIKKVTEDIWNGLKKFLEETWSAIKKFAEEVWGGIKTFLTDVWDAVKKSTEDIWNGLKIFLEGIWNAISTVAQDIWNGIKEFFSTVWDGLQQAAEDTWNAIKQFLEDIWNAIGIMAEDIWNGITTFLKDMWDGVKNVAVGIWNAISGFLSDCWNGIKYAATTIFDGLGTFFGDLWGGIKRVTEDAWNGVSTVLSDTWGGIKKVASDIWGGITDFVGAAVNKAKEFLGLNSGNQLQISTMDTSKALDHTSTDEMRRTAQELASLINSLKAQFSTAASDFTALGEMMMKNLIKGLTTFLSDLFDVGAQAAKYFGNGLSSIEYSGNMMAVKSMKAIPTYAGGGFPEDGLFMANHGELVGQFFNGRTAVANNEQIIAGIEEAAYRGFLRAQAETSPYLAEIAQNTRETADKDLSVTIGDRDVYEANKRGENRYGIDFRAVPT